jgi:hypothetical protein
VSLAAIEMATLAHFDQSLLVVALIDGTGRAAQRYLLWITSDVGSDLTWVRWDITVATGKSAPRKQDLGSRRRPA